MPTIVTDARQFTAARPWGARDLAEIDMFIADAGDEHVAHPVGEARILVIERRGSI